MQDFGDLVVELDGGQVHDDLSGELHRLVQAVKDTRLGGKLTLTLDVKLSEKSMVIVAAKVTSKVPRPATEATAFFVKDDGELTIHNPRQMNLRDIGEPAKVLRPLKKAVEKLRDAVPGATFSAEFPETGGGDQ